MKKLFIPISILSLVIISCEDIKRWEYARQQETRDRVCYYNERGAKLGCKYED